MPQLSLYLDDETMASLRRRSEDLGLSLSKCVSAILRREFEKTWRERLIEAYGSIDDETFEVPDEIPFEMDGHRGWEDDEDVDEGNLTEHGREKDPGIGWEGDAA